MTKIFIGPMSKNIVDAVCEFSKESDVPLALIPSRRQIEYDGGYVNKWTTAEFGAYVKSKTDKVILQRDHGGVLQGKSPDDGIESLIEDCKSNFDLIHIDPWKKFKSVDTASEETSKNIKLCLALNPDLKFEIGTESAIRNYTPEEFQNFINLVKKSLGDQFTSIKYGVIQGGTSIVGNRNTGKFDYEKCKKMIEVCENHGILSKEHNGDYLSKDEINKRFKCGLTAINIAPEFGYIETQIILSEIFKNLDFESYDSFYETCYNSNKWKKWLPEDLSMYPEDFLKRLIIDVSGHYVFSHNQLCQIKTAYPHLDNLIKTNLKQKIKDLIEATI
jgi:fructose/tagatose bisphosphate aldolase